MTKHRLIMNENDRRILITCNGTCLTILINFLYYIFYMVSFHTKFFKIFIQLCRNCIKKIPTCLLAKFFTLILCRLLYTEEFMAYR